MAQQIIQVIEAAKQKLPYNINVIDELHANENAHSRILCKLLQYQDIEGRYRILESLLHYISSNKQEFSRISFDKPEITQEKEILLLKSLSKKIFHVDMKNEDELIYYTNDGLVNSLNFQLSTFNSKTYYNEQTSNLKEK